MGSSPRVGFAMSESQSEANYFILSSVEGEKHKDKAEASTLTAQLRGSGSSSIQCLCPFLKMALVSMLVLRFLV